MYSIHQITSVLKKYQQTFHPGIPFNSKKDKLLLMDFTSNNKELNENILNDTKLFSAYINNKLKQANCKYGIGGYAENRTIYTRSKLFNKVSSFSEDSDRAVRSFHLGIDIWGSAATTVFAPLGGTIHSFAFNDNFGDYGATIILHHQLNTINFNTLYGHLSLQDLQNLKEGNYIKQGEIFAHFGEPQENGNWPPHLHFQIIIDINEMRGDYPGVCAFSEKEKYLDNCPDADLILNMMQYAVNA
ncbi:MAG: peptidoglycan DD-metalloendopeptidase family protein [Chitinophagaceae bacterium]